jgi:cell division protein ZapA
MGQVTVTLNGRTYRLRCGEGEEARLLQLAEHLERRIDALAAEFGQVGDERLLLMAALLITDELWDMRERLQEIESGAAEDERASAVSL